MPRIISRVYGRIIIYCSVLYFSVVLSIILVKVSLVLSCLNHFHAIIESRCNAPSGLSAMSILYLTSNGLLGHRNAGESIESVKAKTCDQWVWNNNNKEGRKEGNVLFNDALNAFYFRLYGVRHMVKDHSDSARGNALPPHRPLFPINSKGSFICTIPQTG